MGQDFLLQVLVFNYNLRRKGEVGLLGFFREQGSKSLGPFIFSPVFPEGSLFKEVEESFHLVLWPKPAEQLLCLLPGVQEMREAGRDPQWLDIRVALG